MSNEEIINRLNAHATLLDSVHEPYLGYVHRYRTAAVIREAIALLRTHPPAGDNADKSSDTSARLAAIKDIPTQRLIELAVADAEGRISISPSAAERAHQDAQPNEPLTLEELREMEGKPVWVVGVTGINHFRGNWDICEWKNGEIIYLPYGAETPDITLYRKTWWLYRRPPKEA